MKEIETKIDKAAGGWLSVNEDVSLRQVPAPWTNKKLGSVVVELVDSVSGFVMEAYGSINSILKVYLSSH